MDDLISRRATIDEVVAWLSDRMTDGKNGKPLTERLKALPPAHPEPQWILCSNTVDIPEYEVLCCDKRGNELIGWLFYSNGQWICESEGEIMYGTIAWREKPKPYKEECKE